MDYKEYMFANLGCLPKKVLLELSEGVSKYTVTPTLIKMLREQMLKDKSLVDEIYEKHGCYFGIPPRLVDELLGTTFEERKKYIENGKLTIVRTVNKYINGKYVDINYIDLK